MRRLLLVCGSLVMAMSCSDGDSSKNPGIADASIDGPVVVPPKNDAGAPYADAGTPTQLDSGGGPTVDGAVLAPDAPAPGPDAPPVALDSAAREASQGGEVGSPPNRDAIDRDTLNSGADIGGDSASISLPDSGVDAASKPDAPGTGPGGYAATCTYPACVQDLFHACAAGGTCTQSNESAQVHCWSNGVTTSATYDVNSRTMITTFKTAAGACYDVLAPSNGDRKIRTPAGEVVATVVPSTLIVTITCTGQKPVEVDGECGGWALIPDGLATVQCNPGTCAP